MSAKNLFSKFNQTQTNTNLSAQAKSKITKTLFSISFKFPPQTNPTANRSGKLLEYLKDSWQIQVLTNVENGFLGEEVTINFAKGWYPNFLMKWMNRLKLTKFLNLFIWPDQEVFWVFPAIIKGYQIIKQNRPDVIVVFMMPYSAGLVGIALKWLTGLPLVMNLGDSLSCTDISSRYPTWIHYRMSLWLEDLFVRQSDAIFYVSQFNLELVRNRQPETEHSKFYLCRGGADPDDFSKPIPSLPDDESFTIVYTGGMSGWYEFYQLPEDKTFLKQLYQSWMKFGCYVRAKIDPRSSSPVFIGKAVQQAIAKNPNWQEKLQVKVYGNKYPEAVVEQVLHNQNLTDVVSVFGPIPQEQAIGIARQADLLFMTLPDRPDGSAGGRISLKTYEYLMNDRPILAAVPKGENRNYLKDKPGVWIVDPMDIEAMTEVISTLATQKFAGCPSVFDRSNLRFQLSYTNRAQEFAKVLDRVCFN